MKFWSCLLLYFGALGSAQAQQFIAAHRNDALVQYPMTNDLYDLEVVGDQLLVAGSFDYIGDTIAHNLAWFDGLAFAPFQPPIYGNSVVQVIVTDSSIIAVGHLSLFNGAAELIDSAWVAIGIPGGVLLRGLFPYENGWVALRNQIVYWRTNGTWIPLAAPDGVLFNDLAVLGNTIYAVAQDQLWRYHNATWESLLTPAFQAKEISVANNCIFCAGTEIIDDTTEPVTYKKISGTQVIPFEFGFVTPPWVGSVKFFDDQWQITNSRDHASFGDPAQKSVTLEQCDTPYNNYAVLDGVYCHNQNYYAINGVDYRGLYVESPNHTCPFVETESIRAYHSAQSCILNQGSMQRAGLVLKRGLENETAVVYASSLWMTGTSGADTIVTAQSFNDLSNQFFGPVAHAYNSDFAQRYATPFHLSRAEINTHVQSYTNPFYVMPHAIKNWPAHGDVSNGEAAFLAPFEDVNANGHYEPELGDYPSIKGDRCSYVILNDTRSYVDQLDDTDRLLNDSLRIEDHVMLYLFETGPEALLNTVFVEHTLINRSDRTYQDFRCGIWSDFDLGNGVDDFVGSDSLRNCVYGYNGDAYDEPVSQSYGFGPSPCATGCVVLNQNLKSALYHNTGNNPINGDAVQKMHFYNYLHGRWKNGTPMLYGGNGVSGPQVANAPGSYMFCSDPASTQVGDWTETLAGNPPGDRRMLASVAPVMLEPGDQYCLHYAYVSARAHQANAAAHLQSVQAMLTRVDSVQNHYNMHLARCPSAPLTITETNGTETDDWFQVYPNPGGEFLSLALPYNNQWYTLRVFNDIGQLMIEQSLRANDPFVALQTTGWANGCYVVQLQGAGKLQHRKWLKMASR